MSKLPRVKKGVEVTYVRPDGTDEPVVIVGGRGSVRDLEGFDAMTDSRWLALDVSYSAERAPDSWHEAGAPKPASRPHAWNDTILTLAAERDAQDRELMGCGHPQSAVVSSDEGTQHCGRCAWEAKEREAERVAGLDAELLLLRARVAELEGVIRPFAEWSAATLTCRDCRDDRKEMTFNGVTVTTGDLRRAATVLGWKAG